MHESSSKMITHLLGNRKMFLEIIIAAIVLALSINIISGAVLELKWISPLWALALASILTLACVLYFVVRLFGMRTHRHRVTGFFIYSKKANQIINVPRYDYARDLCRFLGAAFAENAAIKAMWDREPLSNDFHFDPKTGSVSRAKGKSNELIAQATEYYVLERLSTHLTDYFSGPDYDEKQLHTFARNDIPDVLLSNRFLELFSKAIEERPLFAAEGHPRPGPGELVMSMKKGGAFYSRFDLILPAGARVKRGRANEIVIDTDRFSLTLSIDFRGYGTNIPREYQEQILGINPMECTAFQITAAFEVSFKFGSFFLPGGWNYYRWIESFMHSFESDFSEDKHFSTIGWNSALTMIEYHQRQRQAVAKDKDRQQEG